jgi:hypothetical protein
MRYLNHGVDTAEYEFDSNESAVAFGRTIARQMAYHGYGPGSILQVCDEYGDIIARIPILPPLH